MKGWIKAIILLPFNVAVLIPAIILFLSGYQFHFNRPVFVVTGIILILLAFLLAANTMYLFNTQGHGTAAPWEPPKKLVIKGPYRYVRNPMITSVLMFLLGEYLILDALPILIWTGVFFAANIIYFPLVEEKELEKRFGKEYKEYKQHVPRWFPRLTGWGKN